MSINTEYKADTAEFDIIYQHALKVGDIGICKWNMDNDEMYIAEKISGYNLHTAKNIAEFLDIIVYDKDKDLAMQDLEDYLNGLTIFYFSTFRVKIKTGEIKWVLVRGKIFEVMGSRILHVIMFNVTGNKLHEGHDPLTNLINDKFFIRKLKNSIKAAEAHKKRGALIYIDIDNFKALVNNYGFWFTNDVLIHFSQALNSLLGHHQELARWHGDKFIILMPSIDGIKEVEELSNKIYEHFKKPLKVFEHYFNIRLSLGVTIFPDDSSDADELIKFCDFAVKKSKQLGKNICTFFDKQVSESYFRKALIETELVNAIVNNELYLQYQPKMDILSNRVSGFEVLLRWYNHKLGNVPPNEFIPIAESKGYIVGIGNWVLEETLKTAYKWRENGYRFKTISVNISPIQLKRRDFMSNLLNLCKKYCIPHCQLEIEITEGTLMETCDENIGIINELIEKGFKIAIDDFGTGYSNLSSLLEFQISTLKIDKSIVDNIESNRNKVVFKSIVTLAQYLKFEIIAEGVETKNQLEVLAELGCDGIQGYYFSKPLRQTEAEYFLNKLA
ncbi:MAG TPA: EAL domain-containing protein [Tissierellia bacterium]|nr:EAL domain-containing protein [Tissierellia bacterium]